MKKLIAAVLLSVLLFSLCLAEAPAWMPRQIEAPQTPLQQALFDFAMEQARALQDNIASVWESMIVPEHDSGALSDPLFSFLEERESLLAAPSSVLLMLPREDFASETQQRFPEEMWASMGMGLSFQANNSMMESRQAEFLEMLSLYGLCDLPAGRGVAHLVCVYGEGLPMIATAVLLGEEGSCMGKTNLIFHKYMAETMAYMGMAVNLWGENALDCVYVRP